MIKKGYILGILIFFSLYFVFLRGRLFASITCETSGSSIKIAWDEPVKNNGNKIVGYRIYRRNKNEDTYILLNPSELLINREFTDTTVIMGRTYYYSVTAIDQRGLESPLSKDIEVLPALHPPSGIRAVSGKRLVELTWDKYPFSIIRGYHLYRGSKSGGPYSLISTQPDSVTFYRDTGIIPEKNYYYVLSVEDLYGQKSPYSEEVGATPRSITGSELYTLEAVKEVKVLLKEGKIIVDWEEDINEFIIGYNIYRRTGERNLEWRLLTDDEPVRIPPFEDYDVEAGNIYFYSVVGVDELGNEGRFPKEVRVLFQDMFINSITIQGADKPLRYGEEVLITVVGNPGMRAYFNIDGIIYKEPMEEISSSDEGIYYGIFEIPSEIDIKDVPVICYLENPDNNKSVSMKSTTLLNIDNTPPPYPIDISYTLDSEGRLTISWAMADGHEEIKLFKIYRDHKEMISEIPEDIHIFTDLTAIPGKKSAYHVTSIDLAGNESGPSAIIEAELPGDEIPPIIKEVRIKSFTGEYDKASWYVGEEMVIVLIGEPGCMASFSLGDGLTIGEGIKDIPMEEEKGKKGEYFGSYVFGAEDEARNIIITGKLVDISGNLSVYKMPFKVLVLSISEGNPPKIYSVESTDSFVIPNDKLIAGDILQIKVKGTPGCRGIFGLGVGMLEDNILYLDWSGYSEHESPGISGYAVYNGLEDQYNIQNMTYIARLGLGQTHYLMENEIIRDLIDGKIKIAMVDNEANPKIISTPKWGVPLKETAEPGLYEGSYKIEPGDMMSNGCIYVMLEDAYGRISEPYNSTHFVNIDTSTMIKVTANPSSVNADNRSESKINIKVTDIRGNPVIDRQIEVGLFTTPDDYTGLAGLGSVSGFLERSIKGNPYIFVTSEKGIIEFTYKAGNSAKTAIFRAKDMITSDTGIGFVTSFIESRISIELYDPKPKKRASGKGLSLSLNSDNNWLTADGISKTTITARLTDGFSNPAPGYKIRFTIIEGSGSLLFKDNSMPYTDNEGKASVTYRAGKEIGTVRIIAYISKDNNLTLDKDGCLCIDTPYSKDSDTCITYIILKSDAPALINVKAQPSVLPADCFSTSEMTIEVKDINLNPCKGVGLDIELLKGGGSILKQDFITDFNGMGSATYQAGCQPGTVLLKIMVTSRIPDQAERKKITWDEDFPWE